MNMDDFKNCAAKSEVLSDREARDLFTLLVGMIPDREIPFGHKERVGTFGRLEFDVTNVSTNNVYFPYGGYCQLTLEGLGSGQTVEISEVEFCNPADLSVDDIRLSIEDCENTADKIEKIPEKRCSGHAIFKATFNQPVKILNCNAFSILFKTKSFSGLAPLGVVRGTLSEVFKWRGETIQARIQHSRDNYYGNYMYDTWYFLISMKMKVVTN